jgi:predicted nucleic acid-binding protein
MPLVLDASVAAARLLPDEDSAYARAAFSRLEGDHAVVPALFWFEIRSVLLSNERHRRIEAGQIATIVRRLDAMPFEVDHAPVSEAVLGLARAHGLSVYDAAYLELASRRGLPLATLDRRLKDAALAAGVSLFAG